MDVNKRNRILQIITLIVAVVCIIVGVNRGEVSVMFYKAINICLECIGLG